MSASQSTVNVAVRIRPPFSDETSQSGYQRVLSAFGTRPSDHFSSVSINLSSYEQREFSYDYVFAPSTTQHDVYSTVADPVLEGIFQGINGAILTYGQTGTGKTYTLGILDDLRTTPLEDAGIIPRALHKLYGEIEEGRRSRRISKYSIRLSFLQVYLDTIQDLHKPDSQLNIREHPRKGLYVENLTEVECPNLEDAVHFVNQGLSNRIVAPTLLNYTSSRAHTILSANIRLLEVKDNVPFKKSSKLVFIDLAGSERVKKSLKSNDSGYKTRFQESRAINTSLSALGNVISILSNQSSQSDHVTTGHIPYRDSRLTRLLQPVLSGSCRVSMICTVSENKWSCNESLSTLMFAQRCAGIRIKPEVNVEIDSSDPDVVIKQLKMQISKLKNELDGLKQERKQVKMDDKVKESLADDKGNDVSPHDTKSLIKIYHSLIDSLQDISTKAELRKELEERSLLEDLESEVKRGQEIDGLRQHDERLIDDDSVEIRRDVTSLIKQRFPFPEPILNQSNSQHQSNILSVIFDLISCLSVYTSAAEDTCIQLRNEVSSLLKNKHDYEEEKRSWNKILRTLLLKNGELKSQIHRQCTIIEKTSSENYLLRQSVGDSRVSTPRYRQPANQTNGLIDPIQLPRIVNGIIKIQRLWRIRQAIKREVAANPVSNRGIRGRIRSNTLTSTISDNSNVFAKTKPMSQSGPLHRLTQEVFNVFQFTLDFLIPTNHKKRSKSTGSSESSIDSELKTRLSSVSTWTDTSSVSSVSSSRAPLSLPPKPLSTPVQRLSLDLNVPPRRVGSIKPKPNEIYIDDEPSSSDDEFEQLQLS
ncbi:hypothetical protein P9112_004432 [Eukaryota sp. TZLM1-RC]